MKLTQNGSCFFDIDIFDWLTNNPDFDETNTKRGSCCFLALPCVVFVLFCLVLLCFVFLSCVFLACVILCCCLVSSYHVSPFLVLCCLSCVALSCVALSCVELSWLRVRVKVKG